MKFHIPNYSCLPNPWLGGYRPQIPVLSSVLNWICWISPPHPEQNSWVRHWLYLYPYYRRGVVFSEHPISIVIKVIHINCCCHGNYAEECNSGWPFYTKPFAIRCDCTILCLSERCQTVQVFRMCCLSYVSRALILKTTNYVCFNGM